MTVSVMEGVGELHFILLLNSIYGRGYYRRKKSPEGLFKTIAWLASKHHLIEYEAA